MSRLGPLDDERHDDSDLPDGVNPLGVPTPRTGHNAFVVSAACLVAVLGLIFTLSWVVYHQLTPASDHNHQRPGRPSLGQPSDSVPTQAPTSITPTLS